MMDDPRDPVREVLSRPEEVDMGPVEAAPPSGRDGPPLPPDDGPEEALPPEAEAAVFPQNDVGNGQRFRLYYGEDVMRVPRLAWHVWSDTHWQRDDDDLAVRTKAQTVSQRILDEVEHMRLDPHQQRALMGLAAAREEVKHLESLGDRTSDQDAALAEAEARKKQGEAAMSALGRLKAQHRTWAKTTGNTGRIDAMLREAGVPLARPLDALDADPLSVNCLDGTLRFRATDARAEGGGITADVSLAPHDRDDLITKCIPAQYDPKAACPRFEAFLEEIQPKRAMREFLQRWFGLSMSGVPVQKLAFLYGSGANGKSVLVDLICRLLDDYAATAPIEALTGQSRRGGSDATPELIPLIGARAVRSSEPEQGERFKEGMIKALTSGEPIAVRALHSDFIFITTFFKLTISGNHKPEIRGTDDGIWRRVMLVPFDVQIPEARRNPNLVEDLWQERDGIFAWLVEGLLQFLEMGLSPPAEVTEATEGYRADSDPVGAFLAECTVMDGGDDFTLSKDLVAAFNFWLEENGETRWGSRTVSLRLKEKAGRWVHPASQRGMVPAKMKATGYRGVRFTEVFADRYRREGGADRDRGGGASSGEDW